MTGSALIVEDDALQAEALRAALLELGWAVCGVAGSGAEALRLVAGARPDLITMDLRLEGRGEGGLAAAVLIRADDLTPIVFITGEGSGDAHERMASTAASAVLTKPYDLPALRAAVDAARRRAADAAG